MKLIVFYRDDLLGRALGSENIEVFRFPEHEWVSCPWDEDDMDRETDHPYNIISQQEAEEMMQKEIGSYAALAEKIARAAHAGQKDLAGQDYFLGHLSRVGGAGNTDKRAAVGYLHDILEDTPTTEDDLRAAGFPEDVIDAVKAMTKPIGMDYFDYIRMIKTNPLAAYTKQHDMKHNMDLSRIPNPTRKDFERLDKYKKAYAILTGEED